MMQQGHKAQVDLNQQSHAFSQPQRKNDLDKRGIINGFSKLSSQEKIDWLVHKYLPLHFTNQEGGMIYLQEDLEKTKKEIISTLEKFRHEDLEIQSLFEEFTENTVSNFFIPYSVAPNFVINGKKYAIPMAIEESSVVAAASHSAKFWADYGGIKGQVLSTEKNGQVHFFGKGEKAIYEQALEEIRPQLEEELLPFTEKMNLRGGGDKRNYSD